MRARIPNAMAVPDSAVLRDTENQPFVYAEAPPTSLAACGHLGGKPEGRREITSGLKPGERVIADGSLFLQFANSLQG